MKGKIYAIGLFSLLSQAYMGQAKCDLVRISGGPSTQLVRLPSKNYYCSAGQKIKLEAAYEKINETNKYTVASLPFASAPLPFDKDLKNIFAKTGTEDDYWSKTIVFRGTRDVNGDGVIDQTAAEQKDPYNICFFGQQYSSVTIQDNGVISFTPNVIANPVVDPDQILAGSKGAFLEVDDHGLPNHTSISTKFGHIFGAFHDLNYNLNTSTTNTSKASWEIIGNFPCRKLVVLFRNVPHYRGTQPDDIYTNQMIVLNENSNYIDIFIKDKPMNDWEDGIALIGIQNISGDGPDDYAVPEEFRNQPKNADGESMEGIFKKALTNVAYRFSPAGKESVPKFEWLTKTTGNWQSQAKTKTVELTLNEKTYIKSSIKQAACGVAFESTDEVSVEPLDIQLPAQTAGTCASPTVELKVKEYSSNQIKYQWYKDNVAIAGATSYLYNASTAGNYRVEVSYDNSIWNCKVAAATVVSLGSAPKLNDYSHSACSQGTAATTLD
jgi:hypothetical protein